MISQSLVSNITKSTKHLFEELGLAFPDGLNIAVEQPAHLEHGDYSTNIAMQLAKMLRKAPLHIAELLKDRLELDGRHDGLVRKIDVAPPPGFINLHLDYGQWEQREFVLPANACGKAVVR